MADDAPGITTNDPWCLAVQLAENRWIEIDGVISYVDGYCHKIDFPGFMTRSGRDFGLTATFHTVEKTWRDGDVDRANISRMVVVDGLLLTAETIAEGVELVTKKAVLKGKGKIGKGLPGWLKNGQALIVIGAKPPFVRREEGAAVREKVDPLAGVSNADLSSEFLAQQNDAGKNESKGDTKSTSPDPAE